MVFSLEQDPTHLLTGKVIPGSYHCYDMYIYYWTQDGVENYRRDRQLPSRCSIGSLNRFERVLPITMVHRHPTERRGWEEHLTQRFGLTEFSVIAKQYPQVIIMTEHIDELNTKLIVVPSEHVASLCLNVQLTERAQVQRCRFDRMRLSATIRVGPTNYDVNESRFMLVF